MNRTITVTALNGLAAVLHVVLKFNDVASDDDDAYLALAAR